MDDDVSVDELRDGWTRRKPVTMWARDTLLGTAARYGNPAATR
jgi:hypothetical protein